MPVLISTLNLKKKNYTHLFLLSLLSTSLAPSLAHAGLLDWLGINDKGTSNQSEFLTADQAFILGSNQTADSLQLSFDIAPGYYLYRHQLTLAPKLATFGDWQLPAGEPHEDEYFGKSQVYKQPFTLNVPLQHVAEQAYVTVQYQGCTTDLCYAPQTVQVPLSPLPL